MKLSPKTIKIVLSFFVLESLPVILFFVVFSLAGFFPAALTLAGASGASVIFSILVHKRIPYFAVLVASTTIIAAVATYLTNDPSILITRDTLYYGIFGLALLITAHKDVLVLKKMFDTIFGIDDIGWKTLQIRWGIMMLSAGILNGFIGSATPLNIWAFYKATLLLVLLVFGCYQLTLSKKHRLDGTNNWGIWS